MSIHHRLSHQFYLVPTGDSSNANFRSHQGKGHSMASEMLFDIRPSQPVTEANSRAQKCHQKDASQGKGQSVFAEMPYKNHPSQPVTGGHRGNAAMPQYSRPHLIWAIYPARKRHRFVAQQPEAPPKAPQGHRTPASQHKKENKWTRDTKTRQSQ